MLPAPKLTNKESIAMESLPTARSSARAVPFQPYGSAEARPSDAALIERVAQRDEFALQLLYDRYARLVFRIAVRIAGDQACAEEITQDVFHAVWLSAGSFQRDAQFARWLMGIARHRAIDATRARYFRIRQREAILNEAIGGAMGNDVPDQISLRVTLQTALRTLPDAQRRPLTLAYFDGLTHVEIADQLGEPVGTIKSRLRLGLLKMRDMLLSIDE
jgi:RNA polymerase sigma-70 factor (ECF subfamily)